MMENIKDAFSIFCSLLLLWTTLVAGTAVANAGVVEENIPLQLGDYLTVEYIDLLHQTRSPILAGKKSDHRQYINTKFNIKKKLISFTLMGSFHEGLEGLVTDKSLNIVSDRFGEAPAKIKALSRFEFSIEIDGKKLVYRYVGNLQKFIARHTLVGNYKDSNGGQYNLAEDGHATFPDRVFHYKVATDYVMNGFDTYFENLPQGGSASYGFKFERNELQLFMMGGPMGDEPDDKPFVTLTQIGDDRK